MKKISVFVLAIGSLLAGTSGPCAATEFRIGPLPLNLSVKNVRLKPSVTIFLDARTEPEGLKAKIRGVASVDHKEFEAFVLKASRRIFPKKLETGQGCTVTVWGIRALKTEVEGNVASVEADLDVQPVCSLFNQRGVVRLGYKVGPTIENDKLRLTVAPHPKVEIPLTWQALGWLATGIDIGGTIATESKKGIEGAVVRWSGPPFLKYQLKNAEFDRENGAVQLKLSADAVVQQEPLNKALAEFADKQRITIDFP